MTKKSGNSKWQQIKHFHYFYLIIAMLFISGLYYYLFNSYHIYSFNNLISTALIFKIDQGKQANDKIKIQIKPYLKKFSKYGKLQNFTSVIAVNSNHSFVQSTRRTTSILPVNFPYLTSGNLDNKFDFTKSQTSTNMSIFNNGNVQNLRVYKTRFNKHQYIAKFDILEKSTNSTMPCVERVDLQNKHVDLARINNHFASDTFTKKFIGMHLNSTPYTFTMYYRMPDRKQPQRYKYVPSYQLTHGLKYSLWQRMLMK